MMLPERYLGSVMKLCMEKRGVNSNMNYTGPGRVELSYEMPLAEVIFDFYDRFKSVTQGYGSFDYDIIDYRESNLVLMDILVNGEKVDALSQIVHRERARARALIACDRLKDEIPRQMFKIAIQGAIGGNHRPKYHQRLPQRRHRQMLWWRHYPQKETPGKTESRQKANEDDWLCEHSAECVFSGPEIR